MIREPIRTMIGKSSINECCQRFGNGESPRVCLCEWSPGVHGSLRGQFANKGGTAEDNLSSLDYFI
ncbi:MAG: hypothetical protein AB7G87_02330 [Clostridia bacterium]